MNKSQFIGNVGKDAEITILTNGKKCINFSVAVNESYKDKDGNKIEKTTWVDSVIWKDKDQSTDVVKYILKGTKVLVEGPVSVNAYSNKEGEAVGVLKVKVNQLILLSGKPDDKNGENKGSKESKKSEIAGAFNPTEGEDDLPF